MLLRSSSKRVKRDRACKVAWSAPAEHGSRSRLKRAALDDDEYTETPADNKRLRLLLIVSPEDTAQDGPIASIPAEMLGMIFAWVDQRSVMALPAVCKRWRRVYHQRLDPRISSNFKVSPNGGPSPFPCNTTTETCQRKLRRCA